MKTLPYYLGAGLAVIVVMGVGPATADQSPAPQNPPSQGRGRGAALAEQEQKTGVRLELAEGSRATYRVREQLAGISFPSDAVGSTADVTGVLVIRPDGSLDAALSRIIVDLRTLKSDQDQRDGFIRGPRGLSTEKFPTAEFAPREAKGLPWPFPSQPPTQAGFQLVGPMTVYGNTADVTWNVVSTFNPQQVAGRAETSFTFDTFKIPKPQLARLLSVDDTIKLEVDLRFRRLPGS
ncbi:MAG TPA: YceI family protein [Vicinamibacterales bacterium]|nr:YceI family protein [Vicinamibacterales bacterium]